MLQTCGALKEQAGSLWRSVYSFAKTRSDFRRYSGVAEPLLAGREVGTYHRIPDLS